MPRGVASVFSTLQNIDMFKQIEVLFNTKGIRLELPNTNKVQVWTTEGEMLNIEKKELLQNTSDISDYLIKFWWPQMDTYILLKYPKFLFKLQNFPKV